MGHVKTCIMPTVGQQVTVYSENGDLTDAEVDTSLPSNENQRPHNKEGEVVISVNSDAFRMHVDQEGNMTVKSPDIHWNPPEE